MKYSHVYTLTILAAIFFKVYLEGSNTLRESIKYVLDH